MTSASTDDNVPPEEPPERSPTDTSKPIGDALPEPVEPGTDTPLPDKGDAPLDTDEHPQDGDNETPLGGTELLGGRSDLAQQPIGAPFAYAEKI